MVTARACAALVDEFPALSRARRDLLGPPGATAAGAVLATIHASGSPRVSELAEHLGLDMSTVSRQVASLRAAGWVESSPDPTDGRSQRLRLSGAGLDRLRHERRRLVDRLTARLGDWDDEELATLTALLHKLSACATTPGAGDDPRTPDRRTA